MGIKQKENQIDQAEETAWWLIEYSPIPYSPPYPHLPSSLPSSLSRSLQTHLDVSILVGISSPTYRSRTYPQPRWKATQKNQQWPASQLGIRRRRQHQPLAGGRPSRGSGWRPSAQGAAILRYSQLCQNHKGVGTKIQGRDSERIIYLGSDGRCSLNGNRYNIEIDSNV